MPAGAAGELSEGALTADTDETERAEESERERAGAHDESLSEPVDRCDFAAGPGDESDDEDPELELDGAAAHTPWPVATAAPTPNATASPAARDR